MGQRDNILFLDKENEESVAQRVSRLLLDGGVCVIPTDTIYGIVAIDDCLEAVHRIYAVKGRPENKPLIRLIGRFDEFGSYSQKPLPEKIRKYWPGPLTVIVEGTHEPKVSIRYPLSSWLDRLFRALEYRVIVAPSANLSDRENILEHETLIETFHRSADLIVCKKGRLEKKKPSTIVDISQRPWRVVRQGALRLEDKDLI